MAKSKKYTSEKYLRLQFYTHGKSVEEIAKENGVSINTIRAKLKEFGMVK